MLTALNTEPTSERTKSSGGFSHLDALAVLAVICLLAVALIPLTACYRADAQRAAVCQDNLRQLAMGWGAYAVDHQDVLMPNPGWVTGYLGWYRAPGRPVYFDEQRLVNPSNAVMAMYMQNPKVYKCPSETYKLPGYPRDRVRSVSMNGALVGRSGSGNTCRGPGPDGRIYFGKDKSGENNPVKKMSDLNTCGPARVFVILDEQADSISDATFMFDPGYAPGTERWRNLPAANHRGAGSLIFADGHGEIHKWVERRGTNMTTYPVRMAGGSPWADHVLGTSRDYEWIQDHMPFWLK